MSTEKTTTAAASTEIVRLKKSELLDNLKAKYEEKYGETTTKKAVEQYMSVLEEFVSKDLAIHVLENEQSVSIPFARSMMVVQYTPPHTSRDPRQGTPVEVEGRVGVVLRTVRKGKMTLLAEVAEPEVAETTEAAE